MRAQGRGRAHAWCAMACWEKGNVNYSALCRLVRGSTTWREAVWGGVGRCGEVWGAVVRCAAVWGGVGEVWCGVVRCAAVGVRRCGAVLA